MSQPITKADLKEFGRTLREETKEDIKVLGKELKRDISRDVKDALREEMRVNTREIISHFNEGQVAQNDILHSLDKRVETLDKRVDSLDKRVETLDKRVQIIDEKVDVIGDDTSKVKLAVLDLMVTDRHLHNLVRELQRQGIAIQTEKVFAA